MNMFKVLVTETISEAGLEILRQDQDIKVEVRTGLSREDLLVAVADVDGMITGAALLWTQRSWMLPKDSGRPPGRGGARQHRSGGGKPPRGCSDKRPPGNTLAATEHTMAMMLSIVRRVPQAFSSVTSGEWKRSRFVGRQLSGKRLLSWDWDG